MPSSRTYLPLGLLAVAVLAAGCSQGEQITTYRVPKPPASSTSQAKSSKNVDLTRDRMLAAVVPHRGQMWFFKLSGRNEPVAAVEPAFLEFVKSLRFPNSTEPQWTLPAGWKEKPRDSASKEEVVSRFATLEIESPSAPLELSITQLAVPGEANEFLLQNVNRWRRQISLPPADDLDDESAKKIVLDGTTATVVNLVGQLGEGTPGMPPFASGPSTRPRMPEVEPPQSSAEPMKYDVPEGWTKSQGTGLSVASFSVGSGDKRIEVTVTPLAAAAMAGDLTANVNRWRGQLGLDPITADELATSSHKVDVAGTPTDFVEIIGPEDSQPRRAIYGAVLVREGTAWFFKLIGDAELAAAEKDRFEQFVRSVKF